MEFVDIASRVCNMWRRYERVVGCMKNQLFGTYLKRCFGRTSLNYHTFCLLTRVVSPSLEQTITNMKK
jgi:hypothetical protein